MLPSPLLGNTCSKKETKSETEKRKAKSDKREDGTYLLAIIVVLRPVLVKCGIIEVNYYNYVQC